MSGPQFFETRMGHTFYEGTMPRIARALEEIARELGQRNAADRAALIDLLHDHETAWDNEEESVQEEHADLMARTKAALEKRRMPQAEATLTIIAAHLNGRRWNADTLDDIARWLRNAGFTIEEPRE